MGLSSDDIEKQKQKFEKVESKGKLKGELKGDIKMIKLGVKENLDDEKIKPFIKKITNEEQFEKIKVDILSNPFNLDDSGYESEVAVGIMGDFE